MSASVAHSAHRNSVKPEIQECFCFPTPDFFRIDTSVFHNLHCIDNDLFVFFVCDTVPFVI